MTIDYVNLTPHTVNVIDIDGNIWKSFPSAGVARVSTQTEQKAVIDGIALFGVVYGDITGLPDAVNGVRYIVSALVKAAAPFRIDLVSPHDLVRDDAGNVIGCRGFAV